MSQHPCYATAMLSAELAYRCAEKGMNLQATLETIAEHYRPRDLRTCSNPFLDIARKYGLDHGTVLLYADWYRKVSANEATGVAVRPNIWEQQARREVNELNVGFLAALHVDVEIALARLR
jgi:hypothetical protein